MRVGSSVRRQACRRGEEGSAPPSDGGLSGRGGNPGVLVGCHGPSEGGSGV